MLSKSAAYVAWTQGLGAFTFALDQHLTATDHKRTSEFADSPCLDNTKAFLQHVGVSADLPVAEILDKLLKLKRSQQLKPLESERVNEMCLEWTGYRNVTQFSNHDRLRKAEICLGRVNLFQERIMKVTLRNMFDTADKYSLWSAVDPVTQRVAKFEPVHFRQHKPQSKRPASDVSSTTPRSELKEWLQGFSELQRRAGVDVALAMTGFLVHELHRVTEGLQNTLKGLPTSEQLGQTLLKRLPVPVGVVTAGGPLPKVPAQVDVWMTRVAQSYINFQVATGMAAFVDDFKAFDSRCRPVLAVLKNVFPNVATSIVAALDGIGSNVNSDSLVSMMRDFKASGHHKQELEDALAQRQKGIDTWAATVTELCESSEYQTQYERLAAMELDFLAKAYPKMLEGNLIERGYLRQRQLYTQLLDMTKILHEQNPASTMDFVRTAPASAAWPRRFALDWKKPLGPSVETKVLTGQLVALRTLAQPCSGLLKQRNWPEPTVVQECMRLAGETVSPTTTVAGWWEWVRCVTYATAWFAYASIWLGASG